MENDILDTEESPRRKLHRNNNTTLYAHNLQIERSAKRAAITISPLQYFLAKNILFYAGAAVKLYT